MQCDINVLDDSINKRRVEKGRDPEAIIICMLLELMFAGQVIRGHFFVAD